VITQTIPGVDSAATFNAEPNVKDAYEKGYGKSIGLTITATNGAITYKTGCSVDAFAADARRAAMNVKYSSVVSDASGVNAAAASNGVTDTSAFASAVATVVASDPTAYSSVTAPSASDITSAAPAASVSISGGTAAPTSSGGDSDVEAYAVILIVVGGIVLIVAIIVIYCKLDNKDANLNDDKRFIDVATEKQASSPAQPRDSFDQIQPAASIHGGDHSIGVNTNEQTGHSDMEMHQAHPNDASGAAGDAGVPVA